MNKAIGIPFIERLADLEHRQWSHWTQHMLEVLEPLLNREPQLLDPPRVKAVEALHRWRRQIATPYAELPESEKYSDREWALKALEMLNNELASLTRQLAERKGE